VKDNTLVSILTTSDSNACVRAYQSVGDHDTVIIVNTLDPDYHTELISKLPDATIITTPCNGTPGLGKQSVWDYFLTTSYEYLIMLEGDDVFLPGAVDVLKSLQTDRPANAWANCNEDIISTDTIFENSDHKIFSSWRLFDWDLVLGVCDLSLDQISTMKSYITEVFSLIYHRGYQHCRILQIDRSIAETYTFNTKLSGSEDVLMTCNLKLAHLNNQTEFCVTESQDIYCYLKRSHRGASNQFFRSDVSELTSEFYQDLTDSDIDKLKNTELLNHVLPPIRTDFARRRLYLKMLRKP